MGFFDTITNMFFGTERVKASKAECKEKKRIAEEKYKGEMKQIEAECEASLMKAKEADKAVAPQQTTSAEPEAPKPVNPSEYSSDSNRMGGKKGGKSKKKSKSNRKKTARKH